jgi:hypothetical protein
MNQKNMKQEEIKKDYSVGMCNLPQPHLPPTHQTGLRQIPSELRRKMYTLGADLAQKKIMNWMG